MQELDNRIRGREYVRGGPALTVSGDPRSALSKPTRDLTITVEVANPQHLLRPTIGSADHPQGDGLLRGGTRPLLDLRLPVSPGGARHPGRGLGQWQRARKMPMLAISPFVPNGARSATACTHCSLLKAAEDVAAQATGVNEVWQITLWLP